MEFIAQNISKFSHKDKKKRNTACDILKKTMTSLMFENFKTCNFILCKVYYFVFKYIWYSLVQFTSAQKEILKNRMYRHFDQNLVYKMSFKISFNYHKPMLF